MKQVEAIPPIWLVEISVGLINIDRGKVIDTWLVARWLVEVQIFVG